MSCFAKILSPHVLGIVLNALHAVAHSILTRNRGRRYCSFLNFTDEEMRVREVTCPRTVVYPVLPGAWGSGVWVPVPQHMPLTFGELLDLQCLYHQVGTMLPDSPSPGAAGRHK